VRQASPALTTAGLDSVANLKEAAMTDGNTFEYYSKRENQAPELADAATDASVRTIHLAMADRYAKLKSETAQTRSRLSLFQEP
jgi:hypothetical protein